ncbi:MAG: bacillithiol biosynthesis deacetylase BshB1 [Chitinophagales bacterium]|nr:bacillithiol biosynthesis deacetylase BshB1 [Chitinophagales bacterium]MDW8419476.1 bacillithiol biosynthesis deacetylase BshB1 [Chitinophagales bacterium]
MLDILAIGAHPDDVEIGCGGTLLRHIAAGYKVGIIDLTEGELGTRGDAKTRRREAKEAAALLGVAVRENLKMRDGYIQNDEEQRLKLIQAIRRYKPAIVIGNAYHDRHPDHGQAADLVRDACFLAGLPKIITRYKGKLQEAHRPGAVYHYIQAIHLEPDFVVDITPFMEQKLKVLAAYRSQFYHPGNTGPVTFISTPEFMEFIKGRALHFGIPAGVTYAEGFTASRTIGVKNLCELF